MTEPVSIAARRHGAIQRDLLWIADRWADLYEARLKGTARPYREPSGTPEARAERDRLAKVERLERSGLAPGEHPSPVHTDVLDVLADVLMRADMLHEHIAQTLGIDRLPHATSAYDDASPYLTFIREHLSAAVLADEDMLDAASDTATHLRTAMAAVFGEFYDGQRLAAVCDFCGGVDARHPGGGAHTLRVRVLWMPTPTNKDHHETVVMCENDGCDPAPADCGTRHKGRPAWPMHEWEWLAKRLDKGA